MTQGIVTIATGSERYYKMALGLLYSIRVTNSEMKVAIITDSNNKDINEFDDVVILETPYNSYLDKLNLLINCPYDENIFIDADSLVYSDISYLWKEFRNTTDFSCLGERLPLDSDQGFFDWKDIEEYGNQIQYMPRLHGGLYFIRRGTWCNEFWNLCMHIKENYSSYNFKIFKKPADEPIIALACAIKNVVLVERINDICFLPIVRLKDIDIKKRRLVYTKNEKCYQGRILHFSNSNTEKALYKFERDKVYQLYEKRKLGLLYQYKIMYLYYLFWDYFGSPMKIKCTLYELCPRFIQEWYHKIKM